MVRLVFTQATGVISWLIRTITRSKVSHVGIQLGEDFIIHADRGGGVQVDTMQEFLGPDRTIHSVFEATPAALPLLNTQLVTSLVGKPYDFAGLVGHIVPIFSWRWLKLKLRNPLDSPTSYVCSELVLSLDVNGRIPEWRGLVPANTTPGQLLTATASGKSFIKVD